MFFLLFLSAVLYAGWILIGVFFVGFAIGVKIVEFLNILWTGLFSLSSIAAWVRWPVAIRDNLRPTAQHQPHVQLIIFVDKLRAILDTELLAKGSNS